MNSSEFVSVPILPTTMIEKQLCDFLTAKGFIHQDVNDKDRMVYGFASNSGITVYCYETYDNEIRYEFRLNYLTKGSGDPQLMFCDLSCDEVVEKFDVMYQLSYNLYDFFKQKGF